MAMIVFVTVAPVKSIAVTLDLTASSPCVCSTSGIYTFHIENPSETPFPTGITVTIPAGYTVNPAYMTSTAGIVVATGVGGTISPHTSNVAIVIKTTTTSGVFELFSDGTSLGTGTLTPPTQTTAGQWVQMFPTVAGNSWGEVSLISGFLTNPCTAGTYSWAPTIIINERAAPINPRTGYSYVVTITVCSPVGGVVAPTSKLEILAPYVVLAGLAVAVSAVVVVKRRKD
jgi:hypothetical protein